MKKTIPLLIALALVAAACGDAESADTTAGTTGGDSRSPAFVDSVEFLFLESYPVQVRATVTGNLPTPCHELGYELDDSDHDVPVLTVYSTVEPDVVCAEVLEPFEVTVDVGSYETGVYELVVNGSRHPFEI